MDEQNPTPVTEKPKSRRGFASMSPEQRSKIASKGGKSAHAAGTAHKFTTDEAKNAGSKGGRAPHVSRGKPKAAPVSTSNGNAE